MRSLNFLNNIKMRPKLLAAFLVMVALTAIVGAVALISQNNLHATVEELMDVVVRREKAAMKVNTAMLQARRAEKDYKTPLKKGYARLEHMYY